jgi:hypothetical protein
MRLHHIQELVHYLKKDVLVSHLIQIQNIEVQTLFFRQDRGLAAKLGASFLILDQMQAIAIFLINQNLLHIASRDTMHQHPIVVFLLL